MAIQTAITGHLGGEAIAANSIATTVFQGAQCGGIWLSQCFRGYHRQDDRRRSAAGCQTVCPETAAPFSAHWFLTGLALFLIRDGILALYSISDASRSLANQFLLVLSVTSIGTAYQMPALTGIVRGGGDTSFVFINDTIFMWCLVLPDLGSCCILLQLSPAVVFICLKSDQILKCLVAVVKVNRFRWIRTLAR